MLVPPHQGETKKQIRGEESYLAAGCLGGRAKQAAGGKGTFLCLDTVLSCSGTRQCLAIVPVPATPSTASLLVLHGCQQSLRLELRGRGSTWIPFSQLLTLKWKMPRLRGATSSIFFERSKALLLAGVCCQKQPGQPQRRETSEQRFMSKEGAPQASHGWATWSVNCCRSLQHTDCIQATSLYPWMIFNKRSLRCYERPFGDRAEVWSSLTKPELLVPQL